MTENISMFGGERSFFEDCSFILEPKKSQKDLTKNSSNPEKIYETLHSEIKKVTENIKDLSELSNSNSQQCNEALIDLKIWKNNKTDNTQVSDSKYYNKFEELKKMSQKKDKDNEPYIKAFNQDSEIEEDEVDDGLNEDSNEFPNGINRITSININPTLFNHSLSLEDNYSNYKGNKCVTEPDEGYLVRTLFSEGNIPNNVKQRRKELTDLRYSNPYLNKNMHSALGNFPVNNNNTNGNTNANGNNGDINSIISTQYSSNNKVYTPNNFNSNSNDEFLNIDECCNDNLDPKNNYNSYKDYRVTANSIELNNTCDVNTNQLKYSTNIPTSINSSIDDFSNLRRLNPPLLNEGYLNAFKKRKMLSFCQTSYPNSNSIKNNMLFNNIIKMNSSNCNTNPNLNVNVNSNGLSSLKGEKQLINLDNIANGKDTRTTIMIRNIPIKYTDQMLFKELFSFEGKFDCIYMPYDFEKGGNKGYAFINFTHPFHILYFYHRFQNKKWEFFESKKICELNLANFQGIAEIQKHAKNYKGVKKPTFFNDQERMKALDIPLVRK